MKFLSPGSVLLSAITVLLVRLVPKHFQYLFLLGASLAVLAWDQTSLGVLCLTSAGAYAGMALLERMQKKKNRHRKAVLAGLLIWQVLLFVRFQGRCLGISYVTLCLIGWELDVYRGQSEAEKNILYFAADVLYYPRLFSGPIVCGDEIRIMADRSWDTGYGKKTGEQAGSSPAADTVLSGRSGVRIQAFGSAAGPLRRILWGLFKKMVLADRLAMFVDAVFETPASFAFPILWLAVIAASIQIYADFSGCMDMVLGLSQLLGVPLPENFSQPFFAAGFADYWRRWHMTMGRWFRTYLFYPLGMNGRVLRVSNTLVSKLKSRRQKKCARMLVPLFATWAVTGLWHGFSLHYLIWGLMCAFLILIESGRKKKTVRNAGNILFTFLVMSVVRVMFRASCVEQAFSVYTGMIRFSALAGMLRSGAGAGICSSAGLFPGGLDCLDAVVVFAAVMILWIADFYRERKGCGIGEWVARLPLLLRWMLVLLAAAVILLTGVYGPGYAPAEFFYGRF